jgi:hypothetical protein
MDKNHLLVRPKLDHTFKELSKLYWMPEYQWNKSRSAIRRQQQVIYNIIQRHIDERNLLNEASLGSVHVTA